MWPIRSVGDESSQQQRHLQACRLVYTSLLQLGNWGKLQKTRNKLPGANDSFKALKYSGKKWAEFHWKFTPKSDSRDKLITRITRAAETLREPLLCTCFSSMAPPVSLLSHTWVACSCVYVGDREQPGQGPIVSESQPLSFRRGSMKMAVLHKQLWTGHMQKFLQGNPGRTSHSHNFASAAERRHTWSVHDGSRRH